MPITLSSFSTDPIPTCSDQYQQMKQKLHSPLAKITTIIFLKIYPVKKECYFFLTYLFAFSLSKKSTQAIDVIIHQHGNEYTQEMSQNPEQYVNNRIAPLKPTV